MTLTPPLYTCIYSWDSRVVYVVKYNKLGNCNPFRKSEWSDANLYILCKQNGRHYKENVWGNCWEQYINIGSFMYKVPVTPDRTILWSYDWLWFGQLRPIGNVCCDLLLQSHALVYSLRLVVGHMLLCMIIYYLYLLASCNQVYCK